MFRPMRHRAMLITTACVFVGSLARAEAPVDYSGHKVVRIVTKTPADLDRIRSAGGEVLSCCPKPGPLDVRFAPDDLPKLASTGLVYKVVLGDLGPASTRHLSRAGGVGPFEDYMPLAEIESYIFQMEAQRPDLCEVTTIGFSLQGRPIQVLHITGPTGSNKPGVFYHGLQHAREWITGPMVLYIADHLVNNYDTDTCVRDLVDRGNIYLAPCVNPDGYEYSWTNDRYWRKNRRNNGGGVYGVDLNRNWGEGWGGPGSSSSPSDPLYRGPSAFSEPETTVLSNFMATHTDIRAYMDYHAYGQLILWPFGYTNSEPPQPDLGMFYAVGNQMQQLIQSVHGEFYEPGPIYTTIYPASGGSVDWVYGDQGIFGFTIELRPTSSFPGFELPAEQIIPTCEENLPAIMALTEWALNDLSVEIDTAPLAQMSPGVDTPVSADVVAQEGTVIPGSVTLHYRYDPAASFDELIMSPAGGAAYVADLPATNCLSTPEYYVTATSSGGQVISDPCGAPDATYDSIIVESSTAFYSENFDADPGWSIDGDWAFGQPTGNGGEHGGPDPSSGHTGSNVYGYNLNGDYPNGLSQRHLTSTAIDCTGKSGIELTYWRWLGVETSQYDHASISVSTNGNTWHTVWQNGGEVADVSWSFQTINISALADNQPTVYLRWTMGTTDGGWRYCGWNIDDVALTSASCTALKGDWNGDSQIDSSDAVAFPPCVLGPDGGIGPGCGIFDFDENNRVDLDDYGALQRAMQN